MRNLQCAEQHLKDALAVDVDPGNPSDRDLYLQLGLVHIQAGQPRERSWACRKPPSSLARDAMAQEADGEKVTLSKRGSKSMRLLPLARLRARGCAVDVPHAPSLTQTGVRSATATGRSARGSSQTQSPRTTVSDSKILAASPAKILLPALFCTAHPVIIVEETCAAWSLDRLLQFLSILMRPVFAFVVAALATLPVLADAPPPVAESDAQLPAQLTLGEALHIFRARGFDLLLADAQVASANGDLRAARASPNPVVSGSASHSFVYPPDCAGCALGFSVGVSESGALSDLISNKRGLRIDVARAALVAAKLSREDASRTLELALKAAWIAALQAEAQLGLSDETQASTEKTRALNEKRFNLGAVSEADFARAEVAELEAEQLHDQAAQALASAKAQLAYLLGVRTSVMPTFALDPHGLDYAPTASLTQLGAQTALPQALIDNALAHRPDLAAQAQQVERSQSALALAKRVRWGDPDLSVQYSQQGTGQNAIQPPTITVGLSIPLPVLDQQQGQIAKAEADLRTQEVSLEKSRAQVTQDVRTAWAQFTSAHAQLERMESRLQARARRARDLIAVQYDKGAATLLELLDAQRTLLTVSGERLNLLVSYWNSVAQLEAAAAKELRK